MKPPQIYRKEDAFHTRHSYYSAGGMELLGGANCKVGQAWKKHILDNEVEDCRDSSSVLFVSYDVVNGTAELVQFTGLDLAPS